MYTHYHIGFTPTKIEYGITRYVTETRRLYRTLDDHLKKSASGYIVGDKVTIADIACWGWASAARKDLPSAYRLFHISDSI